MYIAAYWSLNVNTNQVNQSQDNAIYATERKTWLFQPWVGLSQLQPLKSKVTIYGSHTKIQQFRLHTVSYSLSGMCRVYDSRVVGDVTCA